MSSQISINDIKTKLLKQRFDNELEDLRKTEQIIETEDNEENLLTKRIKQLETIINNINESNKTEKNKMFDEINKYVYKKPWNRLSMYHRIVKMKEYIKETIENKDKQEELIKVLTEHLSKKKLHTKKSVHYDPVEEKITEFPALKYNEETLEYKIKL